MNDRFRYVFRFFHQWPDDMSDFENFLCFSSATAQRCGTGTVEARRGKTKKVFKIAHIIWPLMKETKNVSKSIIYEGNDRILLSESNLRSGFPVR